MRFAEDFESFLRTVVNLNPGRLETLQERVNAIERFIENDATFGELFLDLIPAGSWAHRTIIKPVGATDEFDADVLLYITENSAWQPKDYVEELHRVFRASSTYTEIAQRKTRCVRINYAGDFHLDVVPYLERGGHVITNRLEPAGMGRFEASNPEGFNAWIEDRQRFSRGTFVKVVRLVKYLRDYKNTFSCKSIILLTLLGQQVTESDALVLTDPYADVPTALNTIMGKLAASLPATMPPVLDPAGTGDNFSERYRDSWDYPNFRARMIAYADKIRRAYEEPDRDTSTALWQDIFGLGFKPGALAKVATLAPRSASVPWQGESFIDRDPYGFPIQLQAGSAVRITARCVGFRNGDTTRRNGFRQFNLAAHGNRVPKQRRLVFTAQTNVTAPYDMYWKVRNGGDEAAEAQQLRGEIRKDSGSRYHEETTLYLGAHFVDCYVVKHGAVVAKDRQVVVVG